MQADEAASHFELKDATALLLDNDTRSLTNSVDRQQADNNVNNQLLPATFWQTRSSRTLQDSEAILDVEINALVQAPALQSATRLNNCFGVMAGPEPIGHRAEELQCTSQVSWWCTNQNTISVAVVGAVQAAATLKASGMCACCDTGTRATCTFRSSG